MDLDDYPLALIFIVSLAAILASIEVGRRLAALAEPRDSSGISTIEGAILGLQALMIGFTFAMALSLFEARRDAVLEEANAIGTTALRARLLPAPYRAESLKLLREYVDLRVDLARKPAPDGLAMAISRSNAIQEALWRQTEALAAEDKGMVPTGLFIQAANEMIDDQQKRLTAVGNRVPKIVLTMLYGMALVASAFAGFATVVEKERARAPIFVIGALTCSVLILIQILDRPDVGLINQQPIIDTAAAIAAFSD